MAKQRLPLVPAFVLLSAILSGGQNCPSLASAGIKEATDYLAHIANTSDATPLCVQLAFHKIAAANSKESVSALIKYLGYKRPLTAEEKLGIFMHGNGPNVLYPAVHELAGVGERAEPELMKFIATDNRT